MPSPPDPPAHKVDPVRLFVAVDVPQAVREALAVACARLEKLCRSARWVRIEGAHVTLKFIGEVPDEQFESIRAALRDVRLDPRRLDRERPDLERDGRVATQIDLHFAGLGFFPMSAARASSGRASKRVPRSASLPQPSKPRLFLWAFLARIATSDRTLRWRALARRKALSLCAAP